MKLVITVGMLALVVGCGGGFATVPAGHWQGVPAAQREGVDASTDAALASAQTELRAAGAALAAARTNLAAVAVKRPAVAPVVVDGRDPDAARLQADADRQAAARAEIDRATLAQRRATVAWRERRYAAAVAHVATVRARREFDRARAIDRSLPSDQTYDVDRYRGQFAAAQEQWYLAESRSTEASLAVTQRGRDLATAKEAFAHGVRVDRSALVAVSRAPMQLSGFTTAVQRRGLKVVKTAPSPCRRGKCFRAPLTAYLVIAKH